MTLGERWTGWVKLLQRSVPILLSVKIIICFNGFKDVVLKNIALTQIKH